MTINYKFYKTKENRWYVDIPEWNGSIEDLEMVCGADTMLNIITQGEDVFHLSLSDKEISNGSKLTKIKDTTEIGGAEYNFTQWQGIEYDMNIWLCGVTEWVFGYLPENIWII